MSDKVKVYEHFKEVFNAEPYGGTQLSSWYFMEMPPWYVILALRLRYIFRGF